MINVLEQAVLNGYTKKEIDVEASGILQDNAAARQGEKQICALRDTLWEAESAAIAGALQTTGGNKRKAAKMLGISRAGFYKKIGRLGIG